MKPLPSFEDIDREFSKYKKILENGCWEWTGSIYLLEDGQRYGRIQIKGVRYRVIRLSLFRYKGIDINGDHLACHTCNYETCFNPDHLYDGTYKTNKLDQRKDHCRHGHPYPLYLYVDKRGYRSCTKCASDAMIRLRAKRVAKGLNVRGEDRKINI